MSIHFHRCNLILIRLLASMLLAVGLSASSTAQTDSITGPTCVAAGTQYTYNFAGNWTGSTTMSWTAVNGTFSGSSSGTPLQQVHITWTGTSGSVKVVTQNPIGSATLIITVAPALVFGTISIPTQTIYTGTLPATINCSVAMYGTCSTPNFQYQWQSSPNNVTYTNISGATGQNLSFSANLTATTYYRRFVTETVSGNTGYSSVATVTVCPTLVPGGVTPSAQNMNYGTTASTLSSTGLTGGTNSYTYQWQSSPDNTTWVSAASTTNSFTPSGLTALTYFRIAITSTGITGTNPTVYSSSAVVYVYPQLLPGIIEPSNITIASGGNPGGLSGTLASGGGCSGSYAYAWLSSTNGVSFSYISGATGTSYSPGTLTANTWFTRYVFCNGAIAYTDTVQVMISSVTPDVNFIRTRDIVKPGVPDTVTADGLTSPYDVTQVTQYFDGLGRQIQTVGKQQSPLQHDMVSINAYDPFGREATKYLPYTATTSDGNYKYTAQADQYNFNAAQYPGEQSYFGQTVFEASPMNRVSNAYAPGLDWVGSGRGVLGVYAVNAPSDSVAIWNIAMTQGSLPTMSGFYPDGQLYKNVTTDESGHQVIQYKDKNGLVILKKVQLSATPGTAHVGWLCTYYAYDYLNNLRFVIPPQALVLINTGSSWTVPAPIAGALCFRYEYDLRNRMIIKKIPGAGEQHMVFDERDRLVMSQDSMLRSTQQWITTVYDAENRPDSVGIMTDAAHYNNLAYHTAAAMSSPTYPFVSGYPFKLQIWTHYDDYAWVTALNNANLPATMDTSYNSNTTYFITSYNSSPTYAVPLTPLMITRGLTTGTTLYVIGSSQAQYDIDFYDDRARTLEVISSNYTNGIDKDITQYNFSGKPLRHLLATMKNGSNPQTHKTSDQYTYDAAFRLTGTKDNIDGTVIAVDTLQYNELGQLQKKTLGGGIDSEVYAYNIRGWTTGINKNYVGGTVNDYFGMELAYDKQTSVSTTTYAAPQFNGNITGLIWKSAGDGVNRKYDFTYDEVNRLTGANFLQNPSGSTWNTAAMDYSVGSLTYDGNGNIGTMNQKGFKVGAAASLIDQLTYSYQTNSNQLSQVTDAANDTASTLGDFHYKTKGSYDYLYDGNGNLKIDNNKGIDSIGYNYLNLPQYVHIKGKGTITYVYDANGMKEAKIVTDSTQTPVKTTTTEYIRSYQYTNDTLAQSNLAEGRARWQKKYLLGGSSIYGMFYDYFLKDHLGDTRVILTTEKDTTQYLATMEALYRNTERALFYNIDSTSYSKALVPGGYPTDNTTVPNDSVAIVAGSVGSHTQGPAIILKVMDGDSIAIGVKSYYVGGGTAGSTSSSLQSVLNTLAGGLVALGGGGGHGTLANLDNTSGSPVYTALNSFMPSYDSTLASKPKAYLNWMLLDNQFNYVSGNGQSGAIPVGAANVLNTLATNVKLKHSGYLYIWVSNETKNWNAFFDNLSVEDFTGPMLEESHYYPFGLTMAGISDKALKTQYAENKYRFNKGSELQNKEFSDGSGLEMYETNLRELDPQLGRWWQIDPKADASINPAAAENENAEDEGEVGGLESISPYASMGNDPIKHNDPKGDVPCCETAAAVLQTTDQIQSAIIQFGGGPADPVTDFAAAAVDASGLIGSVLGLVIDLNNSLPGSSNPSAPAVVSGTNAHATLVLPADTKKPVVAATAAGRTAAGHPADAYGNKLGASGKPQVNTVNHSSRKAAKDAARNEGKKAPVKHTNPKKGGDHYHPTDENGEKLPNSTHHEYPS